MILSEEIYFEITLTGRKADIKKFVKFIKGEGLEDFVEGAWDFINYSDDYITVPHWCVFTKRTSKPALLL